MPEDYSQLIHRTVAFIMLPVGYLAGTLPAVALAQRFGLTMHAGLLLMLIGAMVGILAGSLASHCLKLTWGLLMSEGHEESTPQTLEGHPGGRLNAITTAVVAMGVAYIGYSASLSVIQIVGFTASFVGITYMGSCAIVGTFGGGESDV